LLLRLRRRAGGVEPVHALLAGVIFADQTARKPPRTRQGRFDVGKRAALDDAIEPCGGAW